MNKYIVIVLLLCFGDMQAHVQEYEELVLHCKPVLQYFITAGQENSLSTYESMVQIFSELPASYRAQRKEIRTDINACRRFMRKYATTSVMHQRLLDELLALYKYVKKNKECSKAIHFHSKLRQRYQFAFNNPNIVECLEATPALYGVEHYKYKSRAYIAKVSADFRKIEKFEDTIHADHGLLKAHNYVYKIELIKLRNYIYHHNIYKFETRYF